MKTINLVLGLVFGMAAIAAGVGCSKTEEEVVAETKAFLNAGGHPDDFEWPGTRLHVAAKKGYKTVTRLLLHYGADVNALGYIGWFTAGKMVRFGGLTPLHEAASFGHPEIAETLIARGADVNMGSIAPLHAAARKGHVAIVKLLLHHGANVNVHTEAREETPLHWAVGAGERAIAELLLASGADPNARDAGGFAPLHWAAFLADEKIAEVLLAHGADVNAYDNRRRTPLYWAGGGHRRSVARVLRARGGELRLDQVLPARRAPRMIRIE